MKQCLLCYLLRLHVYVHGYKNVMNRTSECLNTDCNTSSAWLSIWWFYYHGAGCLKSLGAARLMNNILGPILARVLLGGYEARACLYCSSAQGLPAVAQWVRAD